MAPLVSASVAAVTSVFHSTIEHAKDRLSSHEVIAPSPITHTKLRHMNVSFVEAFNRFFAKIWLGLTQSISKAWHKATHFLSLLPSRLWHWTKSAFASILSHIKSGLWWVITAPFRGITWLWHWSGLDRVVARAGEFLKWLAICLFVFTVVIFLVRVASNANAAYWHRRLFVEAERAERGALLAATRAREEAVRRRREEIEREDARSRQEAEERARRARMEEEKRQRAQQERGACQRSRRAKSQVGVPTLESTMRPGLRKQAGDGVFPPTSVFRLRGSVLRTITTRARPPLAGLQA